MAKQFSRTMQCKNCGQVEIGQAVEDNKWYEVENDTQLHYYKCPNAPHKSTGGFKPRAKVKGIEFEAVANELKEINEQLARHDDAIRALVKELSFKKGSEVGEPDG